MSSMKRILEEIKKANIREEELKRQIWDKVFKTLELDPDIDFIVMSRTVYDLIGVKPPDGYIVFPITGLSVTQVYQGKKSKLNIGGDYES